MLLVIIIIVIYRYIMMCMASLIPKGQKSSKIIATCRKEIQAVRKVGSTFLFLWFHGHCYGCHIITQSEGRKDPFASALLYVDSAPSKVFSDFSCQFEEYCFNREHGFLAFVQLMTAVYIYVSLL